MPAGRSRLMWMLLFTFVLLAALCVVIVVLVRRQLTPPVEAEVTAAGLHLDVHRAPLHDVTITIDDNGNVNAVNVAELVGGETTLGWTRFGLPTDADALPQVQHVTITARAGTRWIRTMISFGETDAAVYVSQTWNYIDKPQPPTAPPKTATAAPDNP